jgi:hypothetical protein
VAGLGDIVMVPPVRRARDRGALVARPRFDRLTHTGLAWADGRHEDVDAVIWCTGFRPALSHLSGLRLRNRHGHVDTDGTQTVDDPRVHLVGYGDRTGDRHLIGVGRTARASCRRCLDPDSGTGQLRAAATMACRGLDGLRPDGRTSAGPGAGMVATSTSGRSGSADCPCRADAASSTRDTARLVMSTADVTTPEVPRRRSAVVPPD